MAERDLILGLDVGTTAIKGGLRDVSFELHKGEILGITGLANAGHELLTRSIAFGVHATKIASHPSVTVACRASPGGRGRAVGPTRGCDSANAAADWMSERFKGAAPPSDC